MGYKKVGIIDYIAIGAHCENRRVATYTLPQLQLQEIYLMLSISSDYSNYIFDILKSSMGSYNRGYQLAGLYMSRTMCIYRNKCSVFLGQETAIQE